jgi:predicted nuclease of predicted toxin-antitoxin system
MKLLFDENLSPRLPKILADVFPNRIHVPEIGFAETTDTKIWNFAKAHDFTIVSKDTDFQQRSLLFDIRRKLSGFASEIVWLKQSKIYCENIPFSFTLLI